MINRERRAKSNLELVVVALNEKTYQNRTTGYRSYMREEVEDQCNACRNVDITDCIVLWVLCKIALGSARKLDSLVCCELISMIRARTNIVNRLRVDLEQFSVHCIYIRVYWHNILVHTQHIWYCVQFPQETKRITQARVDTHYNSYKLLIIQPVCTSLFP